MKKIVKSCAVRVKMVNASRGMVLFFQITIKTLPCSSRIGDTDRRSFIPARILATCRRRRRCARRGRPVAAVQYADGIVQRGRRRVQRRSVCSDRSVMLYLHLNK